MAEVKHPEHEVDFVFQLLDHWESLGAFTKATVQQVPESKVVNGLELPGVSTTVLEAPCPFSEAITDPTAVYSYHMNYSSIGKAVKAMILRILDEEIDKRVEGILKAKGLA